ncbi:hypothetical protein TcWFU_000853 [Taenia crassiceps]|uniref:Uncharacterized protein n=1 Tax=Taenia crassiceps TaxID=6207 RepID=A0ABR4QJN9_9CEST
MPAYTAADVDASVRVQDTRALASSCHSCKREGADLSVRAARGRAAMFAAAVIALTTTCTEAPQARPAALASESRGHGTTSTCATGTP